MSSSAPNDASSDDIHTVDLFLAAALRAETTLPTLPHPKLVSDRARYHGVSALLASRPAVVNALPSQAQAALRDGFRSVVEHRCAGVAHLRRSPAGPPAP